MIVAGTGHRPKYCPCGYAERHPWLQVLRSMLYDELMESSFHTVITGMAIGFDTWLAEAALQANLSVHAYIPFRGQGEKWPSKSRRIYNEILEASAEVHYISEEYSPDAFLKRDRAMIDAADHVFALLNPAVESGGTFYTVNYAQGVGKPVTNFWR